MHLEEDSGSAETADSEARMCLGSHSEDCCWINLLGQMCSQVFGKASSHCSGSVHAWPSPVIFMACRNSPLLWFSNRQWLVGFRGQTCCTGGCTSRWRAQSFASAFKVPCYVICAVLKLLDLCYFFLLPFFSASPKETTCWCVS